MLVKRKHIALIMNLQRDAAKTGKPINIIQKLIEAEENGGTKGQINIASGWPEDNFNLTLSYSNDTQVYYAQKPVELIGDEKETDVADSDNSKSDSKKSEDTVDQFSNIKLDKNVKILMNQSYLNN